MNGASRWAWTAAPTGPAIDTCESAVSMASAMGESFGPLPSGSPSWLAKPLRMLDSTCEPATELMMLPSRKVLGSQMPEMNW